MIVKISRGTSIGGLVRYLLGPGRANEHYGQKVVAMSEGLDADLVGRALSKDEIRALTEELDYLRAAHGVPTGATPRVKVAAGASTLEGTEPGTEKKAPGIVWHLSLSIPVVDRYLSDDEWRAIARGGMDAMGFSETSGKPPVRWVAIRHGLSAAGNDHLHIAVSLVREDGTKASVFRDYKTMSAYAAEVERTYGLQVLEGRRTGGLPGITRAELEKATREGRAEPVRTRLARLVREAALNNRDEAEFVRRLRLVGLSVRPRYATGDRDSVVGYSVGLKGDDGKTIFYGGGSLAPDLSLPKLREFWEASALSTNAALGAWRGVRRLDGRETLRFAPNEWARAAAALGHTYEKLRDIPTADTAQWASVARELSGVYAAWSRRVEGDNPGPLARAADALARAGQVAPGSTPPVRRVPTRGYRSAALVVAQGRDSATGWVALLGELSHTLRLLAQVRQDRREHELANQLRDADHAVASLLEKGGPDRQRLAPKPLQRSPRDRSRLEEREDEIAAFHRRQEHGRGAGFGR